MGLMAIGTVGAAQAEVGACWGYINASAELNCFSTTLEAKPVLTIENITGTHPSTATLLVANLNIEITCTTAVFIEGGPSSTTGLILLGPHCCVWLGCGASAELAHRRGHPRRSPPARLRAEVKVRWHAQDRSIFISACIDDLEAALSD
jgi:hypothetical protein